MAWGNDKPKENKGIVIYCNYCSFPHEIFTGKSTCPQCKKPAGVRPQEWTGIIPKIWDVKEPK